MMMRFVGRFVGTRTLLSGGLVSLVVSMLLVAMWLGILPDPHTTRVNQRTLMAEMLTATSLVSVASGDTTQLRDIFDFTLQRHADLQSIGLRKGAKLMVTAGDHASSWVDLGDGQPQPGQVSVPLWNGGTKWGQLELRFDTAQEMGLGAVIHDPRLQLIGFAILSCFGSFWLYLRRMLRHLDPSRAVPDRVRGALDTLASGLLLIDPRGQVVLANRSFNEIVGAPKPDALFGKPAAELGWLDREGRPLAGDAQPWALAMASGSMQRNLFVALPDRGGERRSFLANCAPVLGDDGRANGVLMSVEDITELERKEAQLREASERADAANRAKSDFLANMSHEIRTPMNAVLGFTELLRRGVQRDPREARHYLDTIHTNGKHLLELINDILDLSKVEAGHLEVERIDCEPHRTIAEVVEVLGVKAREKGITLEFTVDGPVPARIASDPARLRQIVTNLTGNAIKFTERGGVRIVERWETSRGAPRLVVEVHDSGIGIPADKVGAIFEPFVQAESSTTRRFGGTGLGLSISRKFARALGGDIVARSEMGRGSVFVVTLDPGEDTAPPLLSPAQALAVAAERHVETGTRWRFPARRVLVVDDTAENRELVRLVLQETGLTVTEAENGQVAVERALAEPFDLILMDMQMPVMDGYTATRKLRAQGLAVPIIAFTAHALKGFEREIVAAGCSGYLTKPIDIDALLQLMGERLGGERVDDAHAASAPQAPLTFASPAEVPASSATPAADATAASAAAAALAAMAAAGPRGAGRASPSAVTARAPGAADGSGALVSRLAAQPRLHGVIRSFAQRLPERLAEMNASLAAGDMPGLAAAAHWLKGSAGSVGFDPFTDPARRLEDCARATDPQGARQALDEVEALAARIEAPAADPAHTTARRPATTPAQG